jgi:ATPase subunit of ABC transporter with duplicated ATPase domains
MLLDEPTNHLDINATEWLEMKLKKFKGTVPHHLHDAISWTMSHNVP